MQDSGEQQNRGPNLNQAGAVLTIDLGAIRENYRLLRERLEGARCAAVVKADGYGLGAAEVASALRKEGCNAFFVVQAAEGISLRRVLGEDPDIFVLNGIHPGAEDDCAAAGLTAVANSAAQLAAWQAAARRRGQRLPVAVQVDSGMSRLGMAQSEVESIGRDAFDGLDLKLVMSHLACADELNNPVNALQRKAFEALRRMLPDAPASLANSSGIFLGGAFHTISWAGRGALRVNRRRGGEPDAPDRPARRQDHPDARPRSRHRRRLRPQFRSTAELRLATIALGYADGWRGAAAVAWHRGRRLPFAGRVSMDTIILDISALSPEEPAPGDLVELIGERQTIDEIAALSDTIGYEILTGLGTVSTAARRWLNSACREGDRAAI